MVTQPEPPRMEGAMTATPWRERLAANQRWLRDWLRGFGANDPDEVLWPCSPPEVARAVAQVAQRQPVHEREVRFVEQWFLQAREAMRRVLRAERVPAGHQDDILQEALTRAMEALPKLLPEKRPATEGDLRRWMLGILRNVLSEHRRKYTREPPTENVADALTTRADPTAGATLALLSPAFFDVLEGLPEAQRGAWLAIDLEDADIGRLADLTGKPYESVCSHLKLARRKLDVALRPHR